MRRSRKAPAVAPGGPQEAPGASSALSPSPVGSRPAAPPRIEAACYGEANGVRVVVLVDPVNLEHVEIAVRTGGENPQSIALPAAAGGTLVQALWAALFDLGEADRLAREVMELGDYTARAVTFH